MGDPVPFSVLNERLRPRMSAMERLCYSTHTLENQPHQPGLARDGSTARPTAPTAELESQIDRGLTVTEEEEPEQHDVVTEGLTRPTEECSSSESLAVVSDCSVPCLTLTTEDVGPPDPDESTTVMESLVIPSLTVEGDGPDSMTMVGDGDCSDPGEAAGEERSPSRRSYRDGTLPDIIRSGRPLSRRRTLGPVSDTLKEVRREVELSRRRSLKLKAQVDKLQENRDGPGWSQRRERVTDEVLSILRLLLPLTEPESKPAEPSGGENRLGGALIQLQNVARKLAISHTAQHSKHGVCGHGVEDSTVLQQALRDRDEAIEKKRAMEAELLRSKTEMMLLNNQLLEAVQKRLELSLELEAWKEDVQIILQQQLQSQQQAEQAQRKPSRLGLLRRTNRPLIQRPASIPVSKPIPIPPTPAYTTASKTVPCTPAPAPPSPSPAPSMRSWRDRLKRGKAARPSDQDAGQGAGGRGEEGFQNVSLD